MTAGNHNIIHIGAQFSILLLPKIYIDMPLSCLTGYVIFIFHVTGVERQVCI